MVGANVPYVIHRDEDYAIPVHGTDRGLHALLVEIRNDLILDAAGVARMDRAPRRRPLTAGEYNWTAARLMER